MVGHAALAACYDGATGHRAELRAARAWLEQAADGESVDLTREVVRYGAHLYPLRCGVENLINRFRTECYQLDEPDLTRAIDSRPGRYFWPSEAACEWQANIRSYGWHLEEGSSYGGLFAYLARECPHLCIARGSREA